MVSAFEFTTCERAAELLPRKLPPPLQTAVSEGEAADRLEMGHVATLPLKATAVQIVFALSLNVTVPFEPALGLTVALNVTLCPYEEGFSEEVTTVVVTTVLGVNEKSFPVRLSPLLTFVSVIVAGSKPGAEAVRLSVTGPLPPKESLVVVLLK